MKFDFGVADHSDDAAIRRLLAHNPMPGAVTAAFEREPDYFLGEGAMGERCLALKAIDTGSGDLAAVICIASAQRFVGGGSGSVGYIGQLRIDTRYRGYLMAMRANAYVRSIASTGWPEIWFTVLADQNPEALAIFARRPRPSFPSLQRVSGFRTLGIPTRPARKKERRDPEIRGGGDVGLAAIVEFLRRHGSRREFFPVYDEGDFGGSGRTPGFAVEDFLVACDDRGIAGVCGVWDQSSFKQTAVHGYRGLLRRTRPLLNPFAPLTGLGRLPPKGDRLRSASLSFLAVRDDDLEVFRRLLLAAIDSAHRQGKERCSPSCPSFSSPSPSTFCSTSC